MTRDVVSNKDPVCGHAQSFRPYGLVSRRGSQRWPTAPPCGEVRYSVILQSFLTQLPWCLYFENLVYMAVTFTFVTRVLRPEAFWGQMAPTLGTTDLATCDALAAPGLLTGGGQWSRGCLGLRSGADNCVACVASSAQGTMSQVTCCRARPQPGRPSYCAWQSGAYVT